MLQPRFFPLQPPLEPPHLPIASIIKPKDHRYRKQNKRNGSESIANKSNGLERYARCFATGLFHMNDITSYNSIIRCISCNTIWVKKVSDDKLFKILSCHFAFAVLIDYLNIRCNVSCSRLETLIHRSIAIHQPFGNLNGLAYSISVSIVCLNDLSKSSTHLPRKIAALISSK